MADESIDEVDKLIQYSCRGCLGEMWLRFPFVPAICCHCGKKLKMSGVQLLT
jgi:hypothetical protein